MKSLYFCKHCPPNLVLFQRMQLVCGQDLRSFVSNTYIRLWARLNDGSEGHLCLEFRVWSLGFRGVKRKG